MRLFVGIELGDPLIAAVTAAVGRLRAELEQSCRGLDTRWVSPSSLHLTLMFIGEVPEEACSALSAALTPAFSVAPFELSADRFGAFPPAGPPRIVWVGIGSGARELSTLYAEVTRRLAPLGHPPEARPYSPHLTVGRVKDARGPSARSARDVIGRVAGPAATTRISAVTLFRSHLSARGSTYEALMRVPLRG